MRTAIIYRTQHGTTETVVKQIAEKLVNENVELIN